MDSSYIADLFVVLNWWQFKFILVNSSCSLYQSNEAHKSLAGIDLKTTEYYDELLKGDC